jgi:hypothetical protein
MLAGNSLMRFRLDIGLGVELDEPQSCLCRLCWTSSLIVNTALHRVGTSPSPATR